MYTPLIRLEQLAERKGVAIVARGGERVDVIMKCRGRKYDTLMRGITTSEAWTYIEEEKWR
jgi:hypothetical protein